MSSDDKVQRSSLPIPDIQHSGLITYDAKDPDTKFPPIRDVRPPKGAPNVLLIPGTRARDHLAENLAAGELWLSDHDISVLNGAFELRTTNHNG